MLKYFFGSPQQTTNDDVTRHLTLEAATSVVKSLKNEDEIIRCYTTLTKDQQDHVFPLLSEKVRDRIFSCSTTERQAELIREWEAYSEQKRQCQDDALSPNTFFFTMKEGNFERSQSTSTDGVMKQTYIMKADCIQAFDLKPYKYQRNLMQRHIERIITGIEESRTLFHPIVLAYVPERASLTILDGQHRWNALKRMSASVLADISMQIDVYVFPDDDALIMHYYKYINTNVPIDNQMLEKELEYVGLIAELKRVFGAGNIRHFKKDHETIPKQFVDDTNLKFELQYREILDKMKADEVVKKMKIVNETIKACSKYTDDLSMLERRLCERNSFFLGIQWPLAVDLLEDHIE